MVSSAKYKQAEFPCKNTANRRVINVHKVTILGYDQAYASAITGVLDLFALAGVTWQRMQGMKPNQAFDVQLASLSGKPIRCINQLEIKSHVSIEEVEKTDLLLIPTIGGDIEQVLDANSALLSHLREHYRNGTDIASNCSGAFFLAEAGLLDNREATTHWGYANLFQQKYPRVNLQPHKLITHQDAIYCSGGGMAWFDLALLLIERYCGHDVASSTAKAHVMDMARGSQAPYAQVRTKKYHQDKEILLVQEWMENNFQTSVNLEKLAGSFNLAPRTFIRRFKQATNQTPLQYLQALRVEGAKKHLETGNMPMEQIVNQVGYEDLSSFTRLFKNHTGLSPVQYKKKFNGLI